ncbi:hypothetical protein D3C72_1261520 [compost metagenome]
MVPSSGASLAVDSGKVSQKGRVTSRQYSLRSEGSMASVEMNVSARVMPTFYPECLPSAIAQRAGVREIANCR